MSLSRALRGLRTRIVLAVGGILILFTALAATLLVMDKRAHEVDGLERQGRLFARFVTERLYEAYASSFVLDADAGGPRFSDTVAELAALQPGLASVVLTDGHGSLLAGDAAAEGIGDPGLAAWLAQLRAGGQRTGVREIQVDGEDRLQIAESYEPGGVLLAVAVYDFSLAGPQQHLLATSLVLVGVLLLFFVLLGAALSLLVSRAVLRPVTVLSSAAHALGQGFLDARVDMAGGSEEMSVLARAFSAMATDLKSAVAKLAELGDQVSSASESILSAGREEAEGTARQVIETRRTGEAVRAMTQAARQVADRSQRVAEVGEGVQRALAEMTVSTEQIAGSSQALGGYVDRAHEAVMEISERASSVSRGSGTLRRLAEDAAAAIGQLHAAVERVREGAAQSRRHAESAHQQAASLGTATVEEAVAGVDRLRDTVDRAVGIIEKLARRSAEVGRIATLIDEVTDRTNLLGINASIMAAQAGEHGAGFAVVAEEIKSLSVQIAGSTRDITRQLESMGEEAGAAVRVIREGSAGAAESVRLSESVREALDLIVSHSAETGRMLSAIAADTEAQGEGTRQLRELADQVAASARETEEATRSQTAFVARILDATDGMRSLAEQVTLSTQEHSRNARGVATAMRDLATGIEAIADAAREQLVTAEPVDAALSAILDSAEGNQRRASRMSETLSSLAARADALRAELSRFRFRGAPADVLPLRPGPVQDGGPNVGAIRDDL